MFLKVLHEKSAQTDHLKEMWILILKGLKYLNTVLLELLSRLKMLEVSL